MRILIGSMAVFSAASIIALRNDGQPMAEEIVQQPRAQVYESLDRLYSAAERKAKVSDSVTGDPPVPVKFTFERQEGRMLSLTGKAGWRTIQLKTWLEDGPSPGQTRVKILFEPRSMREKAGGGNLLTAVETILWRTEAQLGDGKRVTALFGGFPERRSHDMHAGQLGADRPVLGSPDGRPEPIYETGVPTLLKSAPTGASYSISPVRGRHPPLAYRVRT